MSDYWRSQERKFCDTCKVWMSDNPTSIGMHMNGMKHKANMEKRLAEIRRRGLEQDKRSQKEQQWLKQMEAAAISDYMLKDVSGAASSGGGDISSRALSKKQQEEEEEARRAQGDTEHETGGEIGPKIPGASSASSSSSGLKPVEAPKSGTKWHKEGKQWFEAKTEDGTTYYWHIETQDSRWDKPKEGYFSIAEQEEVNRKHEAKEAKKMYNIYTQQALHGKSPEEEAAEAAAAAAVAVGPDAKGEPYGKWQAVTSSGPSSYSKSKPVDLQVPVNPMSYSSEPTTSSSSQKKQMTFEEKSTPSLGGRMSEAKIVFKKRKAPAGGGDPDHRKNIRRTTGSDDIA